MPGRDSTTAVRCGRRLRVPGCLTGGASNRRRETGCLGACPRLTCPFFWHHVTAAGSVFCLESDKVGTGPGHISKSLSLTFGLHAEWVMFPPLLCCRHSLPGRRDVGVETGGKDFPPATALGRTVRLCLEVYPAHFREDCTSPLLLWHTSQKPVHRMRPFPVCTLIEQAFLIKDLAEFTMRYLNHVPPIFSKVCVGEGKAEPSVSRFNGSQLERPHWMAHAGSQLHCTAHGKNPLRQDHW